MREGKLDDKQLEIEVSAAAVGVEIMAPPGMEELTSQLQGMFQNMSGGRTRVKKMNIKDAFRVLTEEEAAKLINEEDMKSNALEEVEQNGIVFIDEIGHWSMATKAIFSDLFATAKSDSHKSRFECRIVKRFGMK